MKTAVQQIIEKFEQIQKNDCKTLPEHIFFDGVLAILDSIYLDIEKEQIVDAYNIGNITEKHHIESAIDYYNETYTTNK